MQFSAGVQRSVLTLVLSDLRYHLLLLRPNQRGRQATLHLRLVADLDAAKYIFFLPYAAQEARTCDSPDQRFGSSIPSK